MKIRFIICFLSFLFGSIGASSQELNARVQLLAPTVPNVNKRNLELLQTTIRDFLNNNKWTTETYLQQERIECNFVITVTAWDGGSGYKAEAQIQSSRPVYGTAYNSTLLNLNDKDFDFNYNDGQPIDYSDQNFITNLSSLLAYYAYTIVGLDKDSFAKMGGTQSYIKAQNTLNIAQTAGNSGWRAVDGLRNRYWLNENLLNKSFERLRIFIYDYHSGGLDHFQENGVDAAKRLLAALPDLKQMDKQKLGSIFPNMYFASKAEEVANIFATADPQSRIKAYNLLVDIDPANINKYESLRKQ